MAHAGSKQVGGVQPRMSDQEDAEEREGTAGGLSTYRTGRTDFSKVDRRTFDFDRPTPETLGVTNTFQSLPDHSRDTAQFESLKEIKTGRLLRFVGTKPFFTFEERFVSAQF